MPTDTESGSSTRSVPAGASQRGSFGRIVLDRGLLTAQQLQTALEAQQERQRQGDFARLGHILVELGFLTPGQVQEVLQAQAIRILICDACAAKYNIQGYSARLRYKCPKCGGRLCTQEELQDITVQDQLEAEPGVRDTVRLVRPVETDTAKIRELKRLGKYEILGEIARGGMGIIYKARQVDLDRIVALKTLRQEELSKPDAAQRFREEAQAVASLRHPNIVGVHEVGTQDGITYFSMDFVEGLPLDRLLMRETVPPRGVAEIVVQIAQALDYAHGDGVVHRDLKPANIILDKSGRPFLVDFGIAKRIVGPRPAYDEEEDLLGSIPYMAPEYVEGAAYDELCDLYSLGVLFYEALAGPNCLPYYDDDTRRFLEKIVITQYRPITDWVPELDPKLVHIVNRMICDRDQRYQNMEEVVNALQRWLLEDEPMTPLQGYPIHGFRKPQPSDAAEAEPPEPKPHAAREPAPALRPRQRRPGLATSTIVAGGIALVALLGFLYTAIALNRAQQRISEKDDEFLARIRAMTIGKQRFELLQTVSEIEKLVADGKRDEAIQLADRTISRWKALGLPELAKVYRLRAPLRPEAEADEAAADLAEAQRLDGGAPEEPSPEEPAEEPPAEGPPAEGLDREGPADPPKD